MSCRLSAVVLAACLASSALHAAVFQADFETGANGTPAGWKVVYNEGRGLTAWEAEGYQSAHAVSVAGTTAENEFTCWVGEPFAVQPNTPYVITVMLKSRQGSGPPGLFVGGKHYYLPTVLDWTRWQMRFTTPADMTQTQVQLYLYHRPGQKVWFDDVAVVPATDVVVPVAPEDNLITAAAPPVLQWQGAATGDYTVLLGRDEQLQTPEHRLTAHGTESTPPALAPGLWYWLAMPAAASAPVERQLRQAAEVRSFLITGATEAAPADTTPPLITNMQPRPDTTVAGRVTISADIVETGGLASARLFLDGKPVKQAVLKPGSPSTLLAMADLFFGEYQATVVATDKAGHVTRRTWRFSVNETPRPRYHFSRDLNLVREEGEPFFALGIYDYDDYKHLDELYQAGFTYIITGGPSGKDEMDKTQAAGMKIIIGVDAARKAKTVAEAKMLLHTGALVNMLHPALLGYWTDEVEGESFDPALVTGVQVATKELDPAHPFLACIAAPSQYAAFGRGADALWPDIYPVPRDPMTAIANVAEKARANQQGLKPVWYLVQGFDWSVAATGQPEDGKTYRPTGEELRCMSYLALNHGVKGIGYWAAGNGKCSISRWPERWQQLLALGTELRRLDALWLDKPVNAKLVLPEAFDAKLWRTGGKSTLVVVNTTRRPQLLQAALPKPGGGGKVQVLFEDRVLTAGKALTDVFAPLAVHVYQW